jgi:hypothetical protein
VISVRKSDSGFALRSSFSRCLTELSAFFCFALADDEHVGGSVQAKGHPNADGSMDNAQQKAYLKKYEVELFSPEEVVKWVRGASNAGNITSAAPKPSPKSARPSRKPIWR